MWNPPIALTLEEQKIAARTRKARKFFVFSNSSAKFEYTLFGLRVSEM